MGFLSWFLCHLCKQPYCESWQPLEVWATKVKGRVLFTTYWIFGYTLYHYLRELIVSLYPSLDQELHFFWPLICAWIILSCPDWSTPSDGTQGWCFWAHWQSINTNNCNCFMTIGLVNENLCHWPSAPHSLASNSLQLFCVLRCVALVQITAGLCQKERRFSLLLPSTFTALWQVQNRGSGGWWDRGILQDTDREEGNRQHLPNVLEPGRVHVLPELGEVSLWDAAGRRCCCCCPCLNSEIRAQRKR